MKRSSLFVVVGLLILTVVIGVIYALTAALTPENTHPAYAAALSFVNAAGSGDDAAASALLMPEVQAFVRANCPEGRVSACVQAYTPPEWGAFRSAIFRRAMPAGDTAWDVDLIATYEEDKGFSGVCIYNRVEQNAAGEWLVAGWAGFVHCGEDASRNMAANADAPNRVP